MSTTEFPTTPINAASNAERQPKPRIVRNSRIAIGITMMGGVFAIGMALCMVLVVLSQLSPISGLLSMRGFNALEWAFSALCTFTMGPWLWKLGRAMAFYQVRLDERGVDFLLGSKKSPGKLFVAWDHIAAIKRSRAANNLTFTLEGTDGSTATWSSYTFFRPMKLARLIAARAGITIQKV
jgi:hypothetical protein